MATMNTITSCNEREHVNDDAASSVHLEYLDYLHKNGCSWDEDELGFNDLECLKYLHEKYECESWKNKIYY